MYFSSYMENIIYSRKPSLKVKFQIYIPTNKSGIQQKSLKYFLVTISINHLTYNICHTIQHPHYFQHRWHFLASRLFPQTFQLQPSSVLKSGWFSIIVKTSKLLNHIVIWYQHSSLLLAKTWQYLTQGFVKGEELCFRPCDFYFS